MVVALVQSWVGLETEPLVEWVFEPLVAELIGPVVWAVEVIHLLVELVTGPSVAVGAGPVVWLVGVAAGTED